jgi:hypothetical protein
LSFISVSYDMFQFNPKRIENETSKIEELVKKHDKILSSPILAHFILGQEKKIYNNGQTVYFKDSKLSNTLLKPYFKSESELKEKWSQYVDDIKQKVETGYFTCITSHNEIYNSVPPLNFYELTDTIKIARHGGIWKIRVYERIK